MKRRYYILLGFLAGYVIQFFLYGFDNIWFYSPLKFTSCLGMSLGYLFSLEKYKHLHSKSFRINFEISLLTGLSLFFLGMFFIIYANVLKSNGIEYIWVFGI